MDIGITGERVATGQADGAIRPYRGIIRTGDQVCKECDTEGAICDGIALGPEVNAAGNLVEDLGTFSYWTQGIGLPGISGAAVTAGARGMFDSQGRVINYVAGAGKYSLFKFDTGATEPGHVVRLIWQGPSQ